MNLMRRYMQFSASHRKTITQVSAALAVIQGVLCAKALLDNDKLLQQNAYLASIIGRNLDDLDEFDIIALRDLGIIKPVKDN